MRRPGHRGQQVTLSRADPDSGACSKAPTQSDRLLRTHLPGPEAGPHRTGPERPGPRRTPLSLGRVLGTQGVTLLGAQSKAEITRQGRDRRRRQTAAEPRGLVTGKEGTGGVGR